MKISIIGYKNHSLRLKTILNDLGYNNICNFNYHTDKISIIEDSDVFFIATPNDTHVDWIKKLGNYNKYIFCEKPPATNENDLDEIQDYRGKLFFNFNYRFSYLSKIINNYNNNGELGSPIYINCLSTHGLAFKDSFKDSFKTALSGLRRSFCVVFLPCGQTQRIIMCLRYKVDSHLIPPAIQQGLKYRSRTTVADHLPFE